MTHITSFLRYYATCFFFFSPDKVFFHILGYFFPLPLSKGTYLGHDFTQERADNELMQPGRESKVPFLKGNQERQQWFEELQNKHARRGLQLFRSSE